MFHLVGQFWNSSEFNHYCKTPIFLCKYDSKDKSKNHTGFFQYEQGPKCKYQWLWILLVVNGQNYWCKLKIMLRKLRFGLEWIKSLISFKNFQWFQISYQILFGWGIDRILMGQYCESFCIEFFYFNKKITNQRVVILH